MAFDDYWLTTNKLYLGEERVIWVINVVTYSHIIWRTVYQALSNCNRIDHALELG